MELSSENISLIMGIASFIAAVIFFFAAKKSETHTIELLAKISNQINTLERINDNLLASAFHHLAKSHDKIIENLLPNRPLESSSLAEKEDRLQDAITSNIMVYYYTARTNYFANYIRLNISLTEENKAVHVAADEAISASLADFKVASEWFYNVSTDVLKKHRLYHFAVDTQNTWEPLVLREK